MSLRLEYVPLKIRSALWSIREGNLPQAINCLRIADSEACLQRTILSKSPELLQKSQSHCPLDLQVEIEELLEATQEPKAKKKKKKG